VAVVIAAGCSEAPVPEEPASPDEAVLLALDSYNPIYKVNASGRVTHMKLDGQRVLAPVLVEVGKLTELRAVSLYAASITDDSLSNLQDLPYLNHLGLGATPITDRGLEHLEKIHTLRHLWVPRSSVSDRAVEKLKAAVPRLNVYWQ
jgi:hypothetical protein